MAFGKLYLTKVRLNNGGYDSRGRYWGIGAPLYRCTSEYGDIDTYVRAADRESAKANVRKSLSSPELEFRR